VGPGFVLDGTGVVCIDLDHCLRKGRPVRWAREILDRCPATYVEVSPSGTGLHIWGLGTLARGRKYRRGVEAYGTGRYIAVTAARFGDAPLSLADLSEVLASLE
jgi:primase-polymerase (primpol)-like protein